MSVINKTVRTVEHTVRGAATRTAEVPTAALAASALGLIGLIDWPIVVAVGAGAFVVQRMSRNSGESSQSDEAVLAAVPAGASSNGSAPRKRTSTTTRKTSGGRSGAAK